MTHRYSFSVLQIKSSGYFVIFMLSVIMSLLVCCMLQARAPNSAVIVVGTHLDLIDTKFRTERLATLRAYVLALCRSPSGTRAAGYPDITYKHLQ